MAKRKTAPLRIGGVPEHFNLPWRQRNWLHTSGIKPYAKIKYKEYAGGTGAMAAALADDKIDLALLLTEGAILDIAKGGQHQIVKVYVDTPLEWGIHVAANSQFEKLEDIKGARYAISRYGSGSHIMAAVHAAHQNWPSGLSYVPVKNLAGARKMLPAGDADVFFWEKTMTHPFVESGEFRCLGAFESPWPSFVVCASKNVLKEDTGRVKHLLEQINVLANQLQNNCDAAIVIANTYELELDAAEHWLSKTRWNTGFELPSEKLTSILKHLSSLDLGVKGKLSVKDLVHPL